MQFADIWLIIAARTGLVDKLLGDKYKEVGKVKGADYQLIPNGQPFQPAAGKVEVVEIFGYVCPACAAFQPLVGPWKAG
ncbi:hypothetical protein AB4142_33110, partial [Variovorax sp. 2RAF20]